MGITIHYRFGVYSDKALNKILPKIKEIAEKQGMEILDYRITDKEKVLIILPHPDCESINLEFRKWKDYVEMAKKQDWVYEYETLKDDFNLSDDECLDMWVCSNFTKTQFAGFETHVKVCNILRIVAMVCNKVEIYDEAEYYETLEADESVKNFEENLMLIGAVAGMLKKVFGDGAKVGIGDKV